MYVMFSILLNILISRQSFIEGDGKPGISTPQEPPLPNKKGTYIVAIRATYF